LKKKLKKIGFVIENEFTQTLFAYLCIFLFFAVPISTACIFDYIEKMNYEIYPVFAVLIFIFSWFLIVRIIIALDEKFTFERTARNFALFVLSFFNSSKCKYFKNHEILFNDYVNELKLKVSDKIDSQNNLINGLSWLGNKSLDVIQEAKNNINNFETGFNNIKEINIAFRLYLSDSEKISTKFLSKNIKDSTWWQTEKKIQETKTRLEEEIIKREKDEALKKEKEIESEKIKNEKRLIALAENEKRREEENRIYEENRKKRLKEAEEKRKEREIILRIEEEKRKQQKEEEKFQKFLKKQIEKTNNLLKPKSKIKNPRIKVNKVITPDKLKQIVERKLTIGTLGEQLIFEELKSRLIGTIYQTLIEEFKHVSIEYGDGLGYDILAYNESAEKIYVEVKTTTAKYPVASFSRNEISFANQFDENYVLFLVHNLNINDNSYEYVEINEFSNVKEQLNFQPISYKLKIKDNLTNQNNQLNQ
jgi:hypothetical protein